MTQSRSTQKGSKRHQWTREQIVQEIGRLCKHSPRQCQRQFPKLYGAAIRYFGSWKAAVRASGLSYSLERRAPGYWNQERVIAEIQKLSERNSSVVRRKNKSLYSAALRLFKSWRHAIEAAGIDYDSVQKGWIVADPQGLRFRRKK